MGANAIAPPLPTKASRGRQEVIAYLLGINCLFSIVFCFFYCLLFPKTNELTIHYIVFYDTNKMKIKILEQRRQKLAFDIQMASHYLTKDRVINSRTLCILFALCGNLGG